MRKKTTEDKKAAGTLRKCREKPQFTFEPLEDTPAPLVSLSGKGLDFFNQICQLLLSKNILTAADIIPITEAAGLWEIRCQAWETVAKEGFFYESEKGFTQKTAAMQVLNDVNKALDAFYKNYGLTFASRSKLEFPKIKYYTQLDEMIDPGHKAGTPIIEENN